LYLPEFVDISTKLFFPCKSR